MSRSDVGSKIAIGLEHTNLRERAKFYADRNQLETAVFFAGNGMIIGALFDILHFLAERLVASSSPNQSDDVLLCASLLQRSDQHFRAVSLLSRFPDAASSARGKIVLGQSHAALGDWDSVKVFSNRRNFWVWVYHTSSQTVLEYFGDAGTQRVLLSGISSVSLSSVQHTVLVMFRRHSTRPSSPC
jgi:hypothetical protein